MRESQSDASSGAGSKRDPAKLGERVGALAGCVVTIAVALTHEGDLAGWLVLLVILAGGGAVLGRLIGAVIGEFLAGLRGEPREERRDPPRRSELQLFELWLTWEIVCVTVVVILAIIVSMCRG